MITQKYLKSILYYSENTGNFIWRVRKSNRTNIGDVAGKLSFCGYVVIKIDGKEYKAHRLAWLYVHGNHPENQIDHANRNREDNRIKNIREATQS
jgi:citrate synthase